MQGVAAGYVISNYLIALLVFSHIQLSHVHKTISHEWSIELISDWYHTARYAVVPIIQTIIGAAPATILPVICIGMVADNKEQLAIYSITFSIWWLIDMGAVGFGSGITVRVAHLLGENQSKRARKAAILDLIIAQLTIVMCTIIVFAVSEPLSHLFTTDANFAKELTWNFRMYSFLMNSDVKVVIQGVMNACCKQGIQTAVKFIFQIILGSVASVLLIHFVEWKALSIYVQFAVTNTICSVIPLLILSCSNWEKITDVVTQNTNKKTSNLQAEEFHKLKTSILNSKSFIVCNTGTYEDVTEIVFGNTTTRNLAKTEVESEFKSFLQCEKSTGENIQNFYLIKSYKAASSTLSNVLYRYGLKHGLSFVEPYSLKTNQIFPYSHLDTVSKYPLIPSCGKTYNLSTIHSRYEGKELLVKTMPKGTRIFASVRNPISQLMSYYNFMNTAAVLNKKGITFDKFIENPLQYSRKYFGYPKYFKLFDYPREFVTWNQQSQVFGLYDYKIPAGVGRKQILENVIYQQEIDKFLERVDREVEFVFITEHFIESMAIFRKMFQLDYSDVAHFQINSAVKNNSKDELTEQQQDLIIEWSYIDWLLYQRMLDKFGSIKSSLKYDLSHEVDIIERLNSRISQFCLNPNQYRIVNGGLCLLKFPELSEKASKYVCCQRIAEGEVKFNRILKEIMRERFANC
ncbi:Galactose-3-O-sulfotransferase 2-like [Oopsacas minuta]|uniref:Multidrug and toxin extrusion protein n=1 Tax=Oopsacas minuta TaxID=111878 RepID=A0AAV7JQA9_9METZ|nr:Galactose-3-O-sulfotransferase 2-like [Oopsacas minuta]